MAKESPSAASDVKVEMITYPAGDAKIPGILCRPAKFSGKLPAVAVLHGGGGIGQMKSEEYLALALARRGYIAISGTYRQRTPSPYDNDDAIGLIDYLAAMSDVDPERIGIAGHSRGGFTAQRISGREPRIKSVVSLGSGTDVETSDERMRSHSVSRSAELFRYGGGTPEENARRRQGLSPSPAQLQLITVPIMWLHGTRDFNTSPDAAVKAHEIVTKAGNKRTKLDLITGLDHFWGHPAGPQHDQVAERAVNWFDETLKTAGATRPSAEGKS